MGNLGRVRQLEKLGKTRADRPFIRVVYVDDYAEIEKVKADTNREEEALDESQRHQLILYMPSPSGK